MTDEVVLTDEMTTRKGVECIYTEYLSINIQCMACISYANIHVQIDLKED